jgi:hypothetical protein
VFFMGDDPDPAATTTDGVTGAAIIVGITGASTTIAATTPTHNFRMHEVATQPGALTETAIQP